MKNLSALLLVFMAVSVSIAQTASAPATRTELYHVHFAKAALGKGAELGDFLKKQGPEATICRGTIWLCGIRTVRIRITSPSST